MASFPFYYEPENIAASDKPAWVSATDGDTPALCYATHRQSAFPSLFQPPAGEDIQGNASAFQKLFIGLHR
jgi:hypothetical protein